MQELHLSLFLLTEERLGKLEMKDLTTQYRKLGLAFHPGEWATYVDASRQTYRAIYRLRYLCIVASSHASWSTDKGGSRFLMAHINGAYEELGNEVNARPPSSNQG